MTDRDTAGGSAASRPEGHPGGRPEGHKAATQPASPSGAPSAGEAASAARQASDHATPGQHDTGSLWKLTLGSVGVVYGDIGTSPLYAMRESLHAATGAHLAGEALQRSIILGVISLLIWSLALIITVKYILLVMRADNRGEGGTLSLVALVQTALGRRTAWLTVMGMVGVGLFLGDATITPAMSVLSAVEGLELVAPSFTPYVIPLTLAIIVGLFAFQYRGTGAVSTLFGPITVLWFVTMGVFGALHISDDPSILQALNPVHALRYVVDHGFAALFVLGSIFLAVTGGEALYADMGHFGRLPIRLAWLFLVWPALILSYLGQGALVLAHPEAASNPFFLLAPEGFLLPLVILATVATVIASQAVISGLFSIVNQAVRMGLLPRIETQHTSESQYGQIYVPRVNHFLAVSVVVVVLAFGSSSNLAAAYGIAVVGVMVLTTILATIVFRRVWGWSLPLVVLVAAPILILESVFVGANVLKVADGGWVPILIAGAAVAVMATWVRGTRHVQEQARRGATSTEALIGMLASSSRLKDVPGTAVFLTSDPDIAPAALMHNIKHNHVLHERNMIVSVQVEARPYVPDSERVVITKLSDRFSRIDVHYGYMEETHVPRALTLARKQGEKFDIMSTSFFLNRRSFRHSKTQGLPAWQESLYIAMTKSAADATDFYRLPTNRVLELGQQLII